MCVDSVVGESVTHTKWSFQWFTLVFKCVRVWTLCSCSLLWLVEWCVVMWAKLSGVFRQQEALNGFWLCFWFPCLYIKTENRLQLRSSAHWTSPNTASPQQKCKSHLSPANVVHTLKIEAEIRIFQVPLILVIFEDGISTPKRFELSGAFAALQLLMQFLRWFPALQ